MLVVLLHLSGILSGQILQREQSLQLEVAVQNYAPVPNLEVDLTGDGNADLLSIGARYCSWYLNLGDGTYAHPNRIPLDLGVHDAAAEDWDGDGDVDLIFLGVNGERENRLLWLENTGGNPADWLRHTLQPFRTPQGAGGDASLLHDLDGDGLLDCVVSLSSSSSFEVAYGRGGGNLKRPERLQIPGAVVENRLQDIVDIDGDGTAELIFSIKDPYDYYHYGALYVQPGRAIREADWQILVKQAYADRRLAQLADYNGDGRPDLLSYSRATSNYWVLQFQSEDGSFGSRHYITEVLKFPVLPVDVNEDGLLDLVYRNYNGIAYQLRDTTAYDGYRKEEVIPISLQDYLKPDTEAVELTAIQPNAPLVQRTGGRLRLLYGVFQDASAMRVAAITFPADTAPRVSVFLPRLHVRQMAHVDAAADGPAGWLVPGGTEKVQSVVYRLDPLYYGRQRHYRWSEAYRVPSFLASSGPDGFGRLSATLGDINGDGVTDMLFARFGVSRARIYHKLSDGVGGYGDLESGGYGEMDWPHPIKIFPGDDHSKSYVVIQHGYLVNGSDRHLRIFRHTDADGQVDRFADIPSYYFFQDLISGDGNNDGYRDFAQVSGRNGGLFLYDPVNGAYRKYRDSTFFLPWDYAYGFGFGDLNEDGTDDVVALRKDFGYLIDGGGDKSPRRIHRIPHFAARVLPLDWDGDGDTDLFLANGHYNGVLIKDTSSATPYEYTHQFFSLSGSKDTGPEFGSTVGFFDVDRDGDLDLFTGAGTYYENRGTDPATTLGVYYDSNRNGIQDSAEYFVEDIPLYPSENITKLVRTEDRTWSVLEYARGEPVELYFDVPPGWRVAGAREEDGRVRLDSLGPGLQTFAVYTTGTVDSLEVEMNLNVLRCNSTVPLWVDVRNRGTSATDSLYYRIGAEEPVTVRQRADTTIGTEPYFVLPPLDPLTSSQRVLALGVGFPGADGIGQYSRLTMNLYDAASPPRPVGEDTIYREARCSFDPNDKRQLNPAGNIDSLALHGRPLRYSIRFENTGNDTAFLVTLYDTLSPFLDARSLRVTSSSHRVLTELDYANNSVRFTLPGITLLASKEDCLRSQGYVNFTVRHHPDVPPGTVVPNRAAIVFDRNPPIYTNDTHTELIEPEDKANAITGPGRSAPDWRVIPNPTEGNIRIRLPTAVGGEKLTARLFDVTGRLVTQWPVMHDKAHSLGVPAGTYILQVVSGPISYGSQKVVVR